MSHYLQLALNCFDFSQFYIPIAAHGGTVNECRSFPLADGNVLADSNGRLIRIEEKLSTAATGSTLSICEQMARVALALVEMKKTSRHLTELVSDIRGHRGRPSHS